MPAAARRLPRGNQPTQDQKGKRALILKVAQRLFVDQGYAGVSMDALAQAVPVSKPTLYHHFHDKKALFTAVMQARCIFISDRIKQLLLNERVSVERALFEMGKQFLEVVLSTEAVNIYRTTITQVQHFPELGVLFYESGPLRCMEIFSEYLTNLDASEELYVPHPKRSASMFFGMLVGRMQMRLLLGVNKKITAREISEHARNAVSVFLHGHKNRTVR